MCLSFLNKYKNSIQDYVEVVQSVLTRHSTMKFDSHDLYRESCFFKPNIEL